MFQRVLTFALVLAFSLAAGALAEEQGSPAAVRSFVFNYEFKVKDIPAGAKSVKAWVPLPPTNEWQTVKDWTVEGDVPFTEVSETVYGNSFLNFDLSSVPAAEDGTRGAKVSFTVTRRALRPIDDPDVMTEAWNMDGMELFLEPNSRIPLDGKVAAEAAETTAGAETEMDAARKLYDHLVDTMKYDKPADKTGWGQGDAAWACDNRYGNCTDFHSLFIGEARSLGIYSNFIIGFPLPPDKTEGDVAGYHCWAEFWTDGWWWVPVDISEASKHPEQREALFGGLDANRVQFSTGRDIVLPGAAGGPVNFIIYPYVEVDGVKHDALDKHFSFKDL